MRATGGADALPAIRDSGRLVALLGGLGRKSGGQCRRRGQGGDIALIGQQCRRSVRGRSEESVRIGIWRSGLSRRRGLDDPCHGWRKGSRERDGSLEAADANSVVNGESLPDGEQTQQYTSHTKGRHRRYISSPRRPGRCSCQHCPETARIMAHGRDVNKHPTSESIVVVVCWSSYSTLLFWPVTIIW